jgi:hypothetical protein
VVSGRNRESRSREAAGRRNSREAVPNGEGEMETRADKIATGVWESVKAKYAQDNECSRRIVTDWLPVHDGVTSHSRVSAVVAGRKWQAKVASEWENTRRKAHGGLLEHATSS